MALLEEWRAYAYDQQADQNKMQAFWADYFEKEKGVYEQLLEKYGAEGIDVIYSHNDAMTLGALDILEQKGIRPGTDILLITVDGEKDAVDALKAGKINCVVQCTPNLGPAAMELVRSLTSGETISKVTHPEESLFTDFDDLTDPSVEGF